MGNTTTSVVVATPVDTFVPGVSSQDPTIASDITDNKVVSVKDYFSKPIPVWQGAFPTSALWGDLLYSADLKTLFTSQSIWTNKLSGYLNYRGKVKLRLVVNTTPFHAGLLRLSYFPCENIMPIEATAHVKYRETISQLPGVYLSMTSNACELEIPYVSPTHFMINEPGVVSPSWGKVYLHVFEVLRTGTGSNSLSCTCGCLLKTLRWPVKSILR